MNRKDALAEIVNIAQRNQLTRDDIIAALSTQQAKASAQSNQIMNSLFAYIGGILVFAGIVIFIAIKWNDINLAGHIILTLGVGFCAFIMATSFSQFSTVEKASIPLFLIAALLQPLGLLIIVREFSQYGDPLKAALFVSLIMFIQQGLVFYATQRTVLLFTSLFFGLLFFLSSFDLLNIPYKATWFILTTAVLCISWVINDSRHRALTPLLFFLGSFGFLAITFDIVRSQPYELLFLGASCFLIYVAILSKVRTLLINATIATLLYIGYFSAKHFANTIGWPITLIITGLFLIYVGSFIIKLNQKYIR